MSDARAFTAFAEAHPELAREARERITEALIDTLQDRPVEAGIRVYDVYQTDVCNHVISGDIDLDVDGEVQTPGFIFHSGNMNGDWVEAWGDVGIYEPGPPVEYTIAPLEVTSARAWTQRDRRLRAVTKEILQPWAYDAHFAPGEKTVKHYETLLRRQGFQRVTVEEARQLRKRARRRETPAEPVLLESLNLGDPGTSWTAWSDTKHRRMPVGTPTVVRSVVNGKICGVCVTGQPKSRTPRGRKLYTVERPPE